MKRHPHIPASLAARHVPPALFLPVSDGSRGLGPRFCVLNSHGVSTERTCQSRARKPGVASVSFNPDGNVSRYKTKSGIKKEVVTQELRILTPWLVHRISKFQYSYLRTRPPSSLYKALSPVQSRGCDGKQDTGNSYSPGPRDPPLAGARKSALLGLHPHGRDFLFLI